MMNINAYVVFMALLIAPSTGTMTKETMMDRKASSVIRLSVQRVAAINNMDQDVLKADRADFYVSAVVDGQWNWTKTVGGKDRVAPNWTLRFPTYRNIAKMRIRLFDDDGGLEGRDDRCDINPRAAVRELQLVLNTRTGAISGDVHGHRGVPITAIGYGDANRAKLTFVLNW